MAARSGGLDRREISKIETGGNQASSWAMRQALAKAFGLEPGEVADLIEGRLTVQAAAKLSESRKKS